MNIKQAEKFGRMMGKKAAESGGLYTFSDRVNQLGDTGPAILGNKNMRVGTLPSASAVPSVPDLGSDSNDKAYGNFLTNNYVNNNALGNSRMKFHTDLTNQINSSNSYGNWNKRMGELASDTSTRAHIPHISINDPSDLQDDRPANIPHAGRGMPLPFGAAPSPHYSGQYSYVPAGGPSLPGAPKSFNNNLMRLHENTHAGHQDLSSLNFTDRRGNVTFPPNMDKATVDPMGVPTEAGAVFNEVGQGARAYKDVTGKPLQGSYQFAPNVEMDYRDLGDLAKKYKPADLNSPAGQIWLRRILENSK